MQPTAANPATQTAQQKGADNANSNSAIPLAKAFHAVLTKVMDAANENANNN
ncbi:MAG: hypothetical protein KDJ66_01560 [Nitratireductor sp.]|nr:hypothetical protein [Nitratireductor sp.]MCB1454849.1 hypothetical protein [Nitratireductor sp.]